jgi:hypothetical protein
MDVIASALLMVVEPQTYGSFEETSFCVFMTAMTMGPTIQPTTAAGRAIFYFIALYGVTIIAVFLGVVREYVQRKFGHEDISRLLLAKLEEGLGLLRQLLAVANEILVAVRQARSDPDPALVAQVEEDKRTIELLQRQNAQQQAVLDAVLSAKGSAPPES